VKGYFLRFRFLIASIIALFFTTVCYSYQNTLWYHSLFQHPGGDFFWAMRSARDLLVGRDPYAYPYSISAIPYPLTTTLIGIPFTFFSDRFGAALFFGTSSGLLAYGLTKDCYWKLLLFLSPAYWQCLISIQVVPLLLAIPFLPFLLPLILVKPHVGLPIALQTRWNRTTLLLTFIFFLLTIAIYPSWPLRWRSQIGAYSGFVPLFTILGPILLLALVRWQSKRAQIFLLLSIVPQQIFFYDQLLLWLLPNSFCEMLFLNLISWPAFFLAYKYDFLEYGAILSVIFIYIPMLAIILTSPFVKVTDRFHTTSR
jgi:hypothetical protein